MRSGRIAGLVVGLAFLTVLATSLLAQKKPAKKVKPSVRIRTAPVNGFQPTCHLDSNSVGFYFYPANLGAKWTLRTISQILDAENHIVKCDTTYSYERVISDS